MQSHFKTRLLGAFVTVIALAIALPTVLDGSRASRNLDVAIPPMPLTGSWSDIEQERKVRIDLEQLASGEAERQIHAPEVAVVSSNEPAAPRALGDRAHKDNEQVPYAWTLQLGAFSQRDNAHQLRDQLRAKGYKAYVQEMANDGLTRVYVGPELQRAKIEALQRELKELLKQNDIHIRRFVAES
ncbi:MAG: SPOR domain-containing protein [Bacterioplanes sp.]|nr:SPOR domain-containing protein [Bacterioplanes sp.]